MTVRQTKMRQALAALVEDYGYEPIRRGVERMRPVKKSAGKAFVTPVKRQTKPRAPRTAVAVVESLKADGEHKRMLMVLAEKYDAKTFIPHVASARGFLETEGVDVSRIKSRQQVTVTVFKRLAQWDTERLQQMDSEGWYAAHRGLAPIAEAIENFGGRRREVKVIQ